jgi:hypothetical protein
LAVNIVGKNRTYLQHYFSNLNIKNKHIKCNLVDLCTAEGAVKFKTLMTVVRTNVFLGNRPHRGGIRKPVNHKFCFHRLVQYLF